MKIITLCAILSGALAEHGDPDDHEDCVAVVHTISEMLSSEESLHNQIEILLAQVCPGSHNPEECVEKLPEFWTQMGRVMWPGYWNPDAQWMCGDMTGLREMTCDECVRGIQGAIELLLSEDTVAAIVKNLSGNAFCVPQYYEEQEQCASVIAHLIPAALPALAAHVDPDRLSEVCNEAVEDTCPA